MNFDRKLGFTASASGGCFQAPTPTGASHNANREAHTVFQPTPGQNPKPLSTIHAYSLAQARTLVAAKVAGETIVVGPVSLDGASQ